MRLECFDSKLNVLVVERVDPLSRALMRLAHGSVFSSEALVIIQLGIAVLGVFVLFRLLQCSWLHSVIATLCSFSIIAIAAPLSPFMSMAGWFPWLLASGTLALKSRKFEWLTLSLFGCVLAVWLYSGGVRAPLGIVMLVVWLAVVVPAGTTQVTARVRNACLLLVGIAGVLSILLVPTPPPFDYPGDARLVPLSPLYFMRSASYLGAGPEFAAVPYGQYFDTLRHFLIAILFAFLTMCGVIVVASTSLRWNTRLSILGSLALLYLCSEYFIPADYRLFTGFEVLKRLVPGVAFLPSPSYLALPLLLTVLVPLLSIQHRYLSVLLGGFTLSALLVADLLYDYSGRMTLGENHCTESTWSVTEPSVTGRLQYSPSAFVINHKKYLWSRFGLASLNDLRTREFSRVTVGVESSASTRPEELSKLLDGDLQTAWSTLGPQQRGTSVSFKLTEAKQLNRLVLRLGKFSSDFPRGIEVRIRNAEGEHVVVSEPHWYGPIQFSPRGFPYFGPEQRITLDFPAAISAAEVLLTLLTGDSTYSWSIAEVEFYGPT